MSVRRTCHHRVSMKRIVTVRFHRLTVPTWQLCSHRCRTMSWSWSSWSSSRSSLSHRWHSRRRCMRVSSPHCHRREVASRTSGTCCQPEKLWLPLLPPVRALADGTHPRVLVGNTPNGDTNTLGLSNASFGDCVVVSLLLGEESRSDRLQDATWRSARA